MKCPYGVALLRRAIREPDSQRGLSCATAGVIVLSALLGGLQPASAKTATPDAVTMSASAEGVTLCRPRGTRCFIPGTDDPIFIGDVIETSGSGRLEFIVRAPASHIFLLPRSRNSHRPRHVTGFRRDRTLARHDRR